MFARKWILHMIKEQNKIIGIQKLNKHFIIITIFISNLIGICFARTLHYQFYCWYFHTLPYLLWSISIYPIWFKVLILLSIEISFNIYPSLPWSSLLLQVS